MMFAVRAFVLIHGDPMHLSFMVSCVAGDFAISKLGLPIGDTNLPDPILRSVCVTILH